MQNLIENLNKAFDNRVRLGIMSVLMVNDWVDFTAMKESLQITDGNLASHISALEKLEFIIINKQFVGKKPQTKYMVSIKGRKAFNDHLNALELLIKNK
ncbi:MAG: transcriptional regulator [Bacteroidetes bacterium]|nr:transcriptional regulator [Bacteroidota bacterium]